MLLLFYQVYAIIKALYRQKKNNMHKESTSKASDPYKFLDLATKFDPIFNPDGTIKEHRNALRGINHVETTIVNDTNETIAIFNGELTKSKHFADNEKPRYPGPIDACIYLDKSARPVCDIVAQLWDPLSATSNDHFPSPSFLNIDKEFFAASMGNVENIQKPDVNDIDIDRIDPKLLNRFVSSIRSQYLSPENLEKVDENNFEEDVWNYPTVLDGKHVAILDEVKSSGATLTIAEQLIDRAFQGKVRLEPIYWSVPPVISWKSESGSLCTDEYATTYVPPWYDSETSDGRYGIDDRNTETLAKSRSKRERLGRYILSVTRDTMDRKSLDLVHDIEKLAERTNDNRIAVRPIVDADIQEQKRKISERFGLPFRDIVPALQRADSQDFGEAIDKIKATKKKS